jgi:plasmid stabilization system protein ParE
MAKIRWSHEAEQWLKEIYEYISEDNPTAAEKVVSGIYDKAQKSAEELKGDINPTAASLGHKYREP